MTTVIAIIICFLVTIASAYIAAMANKTSEATERKFMELQSYVDSHILGIESDIKVINRELTINEQSHGVLSMQIQELSKLSKTEELRKEVLHTREKKK